jgi:hypothetical protein
MGAGCAERLTSGSARGSRRNSSGLLSRDQGAFFGEACKDGQAVFSIRFVFKKPLERERRVQYEITHRRCPS